MSRLVVYVIFWFVIASNAVVDIAKNHESIEGVCAADTESGSKTQGFQPNPQQFHETSNCAVTVAFLVCNEKKTSDGEVNRNLTHQIRQLIVSLKSIALAERYTGNTLGGTNGRQCLDVKLLTNDKEIFENVEAVVQTWDHQFKKFLELSYVPAFYPKGIEWTDQEYRPCGGIRVFLDQILPHTDSIIYMDTGMVLLNSVQHLRKQFAEFKKETVAAMAMTTLQKKTQNTRGYNPKSYDSGIILMNLTRMREIDWTQRLGMVSKLLFEKRVFDDQEILRAYFKHFPHQVQKLPCNWNFSPKNCKFSKKCAPDGISGAQGFFEKMEGLKSFQNLYQTYEELEFGEQFSLDDFITNLEKQILTSSTSEGTCDAPKNFANHVIKAVEKFRSIDKLLPLSRNNKNMQAISPSNACITLCITFCEPPLAQERVPSLQFNQTVVLLKSLILMEKLAPTPKCINAIILSDDMASFNGLVSNIMETWDTNYTELLQFTYVPVSYSNDLAWMKTIFKRCASLRLNYAELLPEYDTVIHVDTDMIFTRAPSELWAEFTRFSEQTLVIMAQKFNYAKHVRASKNYYWPTRLQSGMMLMNLTRMRDVGFPTKVNMISTLFRKYIERKGQPVQILLGIYFRHFPEQLSLLDCSWNYVPRFCSKELQSKCQSISTVHGVTSTFGPASTEPIFHLIFKHYQDMDMTNPDAFAVLRSFVDKFWEASVAKLNNVEGTSDCATLNFKQMFMKNIHERLLAAI